MRRDRREDSCRFGLASANWGTSLLVTVGGLALVGLALAGYAQEGSARPGVRSTGDSGVQLQVEWRLIGVGSLDRGGGPFDPTDVDQIGLGGVFLPPPGGPVCGDGVLELPEVCDGTDFGGQTCQAFGFDGGSLGCTAGCELDTSGCTTQTAFCGNGLLDVGEACDGSDLGGTSCQSLGFTGGSLTCSSQCSFDTSGCTMAPPPTSIGSMEGYEHRTNDSDLCWKFNASDLPDGTVLTVNVSGQSSGTTTAVVSMGMARPRFRITNFGTYNWTVTARDPSGMTINLTGGTRGQIMVGSTAPGCP